MVLCFLKWFLYSGLNVLTICFGEFFVHSICQLSSWYVFNTSYPGWLDTGVHWGTWGECHGMHLELQLLTLCRVDKSIQLSVCALSEGGCSVYQAHVHKFLWKRAWHHWCIMWWCWGHMMTFWWCGVFQMMTFTSVLKGYKKKNAQEGWGSKFQFYRVKINTP